MEWKKYLILLLAFLLVLKVFSCRLVDYETEGFKKQCPSVSTLVVVTDNEVEAFLPLWQEYIKSGMSKEVSDKISLISGDFAEKLPLRIQVWLNKHCWTPERFFYVEQRLQAILRTLYLQQHTSAVKQVLTEQMENETDEDKVKMYQDMIVIQDKISGIEGVTSSEISLVQKRQKQIENILNSGK